MLEQALFVRLKCQGRFYFPYFCMIYIQLYQNSMLFCVCSFTLLCFEWVSETKTSQV